MKKLTFRQTQLAALNVLRFIDKLCREKHLTYYLMYGSLIGAVRHQGIIPWDDDIDIIMPRPDYEKLIDFCSHNENAILPYQLFESTIDSRYPHPIARISDSRYKLEFENEKDYGLGVFVDIYPLDGVGDDFSAAKRHIKKGCRNASLCFLTSRKHFGRDNTKSTARMIIKFPAYLYALARGNKHFIQNAQRLCKHFDYESSQYVSCVAQPWRESRNENKNVYKKEWFTPIEARFEDINCFIPSGYDQILKMGYGDYLTPPPKDDRAPHHSYVAYKKSDE